MAEVVLVTGAWAGLGLAVAHAATAAGESSLGLGVISHRHRGGPW